MEVSIDEIKVKVTYCLRRFSTDDLTTEKVIAKCFREEQNARTVLSVLKILISLFSWQHVVKKTQLSTLYNYAKVSVVNESRVDYTSLNSADHTESCFALPLTLVDILVFFLVSGESDCSSSPTFFLFPLSEAIQAAMKGVAGRVYYHDREIDSASAQQIKCLGS